ncbi:hypothetical protein COX68_02685 [Candidatus Falkowbacteria bacterium CG_4_10_14_0_2_um_filter_41_15]|uniref:Lipoprotein n=1 Tax=Candidatus Falkowbacteria bacterium CG_4_10_14_0_2_um_filter_41_15 TaxID=1974554 RepID=A0A2M7VY09_9BACT|nr:MAG: hypothetical protein COX68_02685 [Candidatus Falkowbacteria bacterium CG_4_10_14_0_2_um_filter_41_15]
MKNYSVLLFVVFIIAILVGCKKDKSTDPIQFQSETEKSLSLENLRDSQVGQFSLTDQITNTDSMVCNKIDTMGQTILKLGNNCIGVFDWESGIYCAGINPTKIEAAVFSPYSLILTENGNQQSAGQRKTLLICKNNQFSFGIVINTIIVKSIVYTNNTLKLTCNGTTVHGSSQPDYCITVNL